MRALRECSVFETSLAVYKCNSIYLGPRLVNTKINTENCGNTVISDSGSYVAELTTWRVEVSFVCALFEGHLSVGMLPTGISVHFEYNNFILPGRIAASKLAGKLHKRC